MLGLNGVMDSCQAADSVPQFFIIYLFWIWLRILWLIFTNEPKKCTSQSPADNKPSSSLPKIQFMRRKSREKKKKIQLCDVKNMPLNCWSLGVLLAVGILAGA